MAASIEFATSNFSSFTMRVFFHLLAGCSFLLFSSCTGAPARVVAEAPAANSAAAAIEQFDSDKDGLLNEAELAKAPGLKAGLQKGDADLDGKLSAAEINARIANWAKIQTARMPLILILTRRGQPLVDAEVKVIPEAFQGTALPSATTKTNGGGMAMPSSPKEGANGLPPGYFRIEIQSAKGDIPAAFNTATTLGVEMANDSKIAEGPVRIEIP